jgi:hypothetical protein
MIHPNVTLSRYLTGVLYRVFGRLELPAGYRYTTCARWSNDRLFPVILLT